MLIFLEVCKNDLGKHLCSSISLFLHFLAVRKKIDALVYSSLIFQAKRTKLIVLQIQTQTRLFHKCLEKLKFHENCTVYYTPV